MPRLTATRILIVAFFASFFCVFYFTQPFSFPNSNGDGHDYGIDELKDSSEEYKEPTGFQAGRRLFKELPELDGKSPNQLKFFKLDNNGYALSAFTDDRNGNMGYKFVRVMMMITHTDNFECKINGRASESTNLYEFSENHSMKWKLFILNCKLPKGIEFSDVESVTVIRKTSKASVEVPIIYRIQDETRITPDEYELKMSICVPALFGKAYDARRIIEFIELNSFQGIERIFIYYDPNEISDEKLKAALQYYQDNHILEPIEFKLPFRSDEVWYHGQLAAITDCLLRNTGLTKFTFFHDIDEFFVPVLQQSSLYDTLSILFENKTIGSQRTSLKYISTKIKDAPVTINNIVSTKTFENRFTKCVVRPEMVFEQGIHHTSRVIQDHYQTAAHNGSLLRVYHYKEPKYCCSEESLLKKRHGDDLRKQFDYVVNLLDV